MCSSQTFPTFPVDLDVKPAPTPSNLRPRGTNKLLSTQNGVGLALLRLEHLAGWEKGKWTLEFENKERKWEIKPWWPDWWPIQVGDETQ